MHNAFCWSSRLLALQIDTDSNLFTFMPIIGVALILMWFVMSMRKRAAKAGSRVTAREQLERLKQREGMRDDLGRLMVEIEEMAKRLASQLDAKAIRLEKLLDETDIQIKRIEKMMNRAGTHLHNNENQYDNRDATGFNDAGAFNSNGYGPPNNLSGSPDPPDLPTLPQPDDQLTQSVYALADQGIPSVDIARQLDEQIGKVELILALRNVS